MDANLQNYIESFSRLRALVVGEAIIDSYLHGTAERICREAPAPIVAISHRENVPGGAANTAVNARSLGADVAFLSVVGDDHEGHLLRQALQDRGVSDSCLITQYGRRTLAKHRVVAGPQILVRFDEGSTEPVSAEVEARLVIRLRELFPRCDAVIISDYGYGVLTPRVVEEIGRLQRETPRVLVVDAKSLTDYRHLGVTAVKPNFEEVRRLLANPVADDGRRTTDDNSRRPSSIVHRPSSKLERADQVAQQGDRLLEMTGAQIVAVTLDTEGAIIIERDNRGGSAGGHYRTYAKPATHSWAVGAGDTFVSTLALALAAGTDGPRAGELASAAAGIVVAKDGTATCSARDLRAHFSVGGKYLNSLEQLDECMHLHRAQGSRIVFTNGCFDLLHRGHIAMLNKAKALGDVLVVGVNSDESTRHLKGLGRPINRLEDRVQVLAALSCVDYIAPFEEDTPLPLIRAVRPDIFVKGGNYTRDALPEAPEVEELGGVVRILPYLHDQTTTGLIDRIRQRDLLPVDDGNERQRRSGATIGGREPAIQEEALIQNPKSKIQNQGSDPLLESAGHYGYG